MGAHDRAAQAERRFDLVMYPSERPSGVAGVVVLAADAALGAGLRAGRAAGTVAGAGLRAAETAGAVVARVPGAGRLAQTAEALVRPLTEDGAAARVAGGRAAADGLQRIVELVAPVAVDALDLNAIIARVDLDAALAGVDVDALVSRIDIDRVVSQIDIDALVSRIDIDALVSRIDIDALVSRIEIDALVSRIEIDALVSRIDIDALV
ncbi:MAG: hypothetical protein MUC84_04650, partial [Solirubrobacteraceae bacterium]|nr:hypothetical protein [Solirubrobacteraceae bacterium]